MEPDIIILPLLVAYLLDLLLGDPRWLPHPIRLYGLLISTGERWLNKGGFRFLKGAILSIALVLVVFIILFAFLQFLLRDYPLLYYIISSVLLFYALANKSLIQEGRAVFDALQHGGLEAGRKRLSWIVGRETKNLSEPQIRTAVFETMSENLSDGVVAPLFYYALLGVPGALAYKMVNTLDSMIGYKSEKYYLFGKFAARLDDVLNFIPARITALLMTLVSAKPFALKTVLKYGARHASPNAGYPEAALAGILNCRFGGPNYYHGQLVEKPYIGDATRPLAHEEFKRVALINHKVCFLTVLLICILYYLA
jgi:adenosylcobinamide-phosphate synthase